MIERLPHDQAQRELALDPSQSFLVQAPAGSGKTELLTDRILALLATVQRPEEIVAITFTRKAAAEMHDRVLEKLRAGRGPEPQGRHRRRSWELARAALARDAQLGWGLLDHPARLAIRTIDSFCASLVRAMPWLSELGGMPAITDDAQPHYLAAASATLAMADEEPAVRALLAHLDVDVQAARQALAGMLAQRDQWLPLLGHGRDRELLESALREAVREQLAALAESLPAGWSQALAEPARMACEALAAGGGDNPLQALQDWDGAALPASPDALPRWRCLAHLLLTGKGELRKPGGINAKLGFAPKTAHKERFAQWLQAAAAEDTGWCARLAAVRDIPDPRLSDAQWEILGAQLHVLLLAAAQLRVRFAQTGEVDFIEIAQRAASALGSADDPGELLLSLDAGLRHLLIDEFQDTSQAQVELLRTLTSGWQPGDGRTLFLVGDPMQSIYRFRKAEVGLFLQVRDQGIGQVRPRFLQLTDNFRSQAGIVDWVNRVFGALLPARDEPATGAIRYAPSSAFNPALDGPAVSVHAVCGQGDAAEGQAEALAVRLVREALDRHRGSEHPVAVLVRARNHLGALARRLAQAGVPVRAVELVPLAMRPVVSDLVQLVRALSHPGDRMAWLSVLRAPWCGLTLASLTELFGNDHLTPVPLLMARALADGTAERLPTDERLRLAHAAQALLDRGNASGAEPLAAWVEAVWTRLGGPSVYGTESDLADAQSVFQLIERIAPYGGLDLARLETEIGRLYAAPQSGSPVVEIMTMHKAKGLQFDTVILYGLQRVPRGDAAPLVRFEQSEGRVLLGPIKACADTEADPLSRYLAVREKQRADYETDRLLYVAATRARERLHLIGTVAPDEADQPKPPPAASLLGRLWPYVGHEAEVIVPAHAMEDSDAPLTGPALRRIARQALPDVAPAAGIAGAGVGGLEGAVGASAPAESEAVGNRPDKLAAFRLAAEPAYESIVGTVAHAWLAWLGAEGPAAWPAPDELPQWLPRIRRQLGRAGVPDAQLDACAAQVMETLQATLSSERGRWLLGHADARREWPLLDLQGKVSIIDLALSSEAGWLVVDYKTGRPAPGESLESFSARMRARYAAQLQRYCAQVHALDARPVQAALYFPRADLWLEFAPEEMA